jgi:Histidine-specific methyltransferase, SAM-dependent
MKNTHNILHSTDSIIRDIPSTEQKKKETTIAHLDDLFSNNANAVFLYDDETSGELFIRAVSTWEYGNLTSKEEIVYTTHSNVLQPYFSNIKNIIIYGPGDGRKDLVNLQHIDPSLQILEGKIIHPVDVNISFAHNAGENIKAVCMKKGINTLTSACVGDFIHAKELQQQKVSDKLYAFFGGSIWNFSDEEIVTLLKNITSDKIHGSRFALITAFFEPDFQDYAERLSWEETLLKSYNTQAVTERVLFGLQRLGIPSDSIAFDVQYERNHDHWWRVLIGAKVIKDFSISYNWKTYSASAGNSLRAIQSRRFKKDYFTQLARQAEHSIEQYYMEGDVGCIVTRTKEENPENETVEGKELRVQKMQKASFFSISAIAAIWLMSNLSGQYQDYKDRIKRKKESHTEINKKASMKW